MEEIDWRAAEAFAIDGIGGITHRLHEAARGGTGSKRRAAKLAIAGTTTSNAIQTQNHLSADSPAD